MSQTMPDPVEDAPQNLPGVTHRAIAFGLHWHSNLPLPLFTPDPTYAAPDVLVRQVSEPAHRTFKPGRPGVRLQRAADGIRCTVESDSQLEAVLDLFSSGLDGTDRVEVAPGPAWNGALPVFFYGSVTALLLARRGAAPLHGSAVAIDGHAVLICGPSGSGKSTLAAGLISCGGRLISDDLSCLQLDPFSRRVGLSPGRRSMRLFAGTADLLVRTIASSAPPLQSEGKLVVFPPCVDAKASFPLRTLVLLGTEPADLATANKAVEKAAMLTAQSFRPVLMPRMPGHALRLATTALAAQEMDVLCLPSVGDRAAAEFRTRPEKLLKMIS